MMIVITPDDFRSLSPACREELLSLLNSRHESPAYYEEDYQQEPDLPTIDDVLEVKHVIDITAEQTRDLVANISAKSKETLKLFVPGTPVALDTLIGEGCPYRDFSDLKRSFVGAVNRRLRTVTGDRLAVLFSSDRDKTRIRITPASAASLRDVPGRENSKLSALSLTNGRFFKNFAPQSFGSSRPEAEICESQP